MNQLSECNNYVREHGVGTHYLDYSYDVFRLFEDFSEIYNRIVSDKAVLVHADYATTPNRITVVVREHELQVINNINQMVSIRRAKVLIASLTPGKTVEVVCERRFIATLRVYCAQTYEGLSVRATDKGCVISHRQGTERSVRSSLHNQMTNYVGPIPIDGIAINTARCIVSAYNVQHGTSFSVNSADNVITNGKRAAPKKMVSQLSASTDATIKKAASDQHISQTEYDAVKSEFQRILNNMRELILM